MEHQTTLGEKFKDTAKDVYDREVTDALTRANQILSDTGDRSGDALAAAVSHGHLAALQTMTVSCVVGLRKLHKHLPEEQQTEEVFDRILAGAIDGMQALIERSAMQTVRELREIEREEAQK